MPFRKGTFISCCRRFARLMPPPESLLERPLAPRQVRLSLLLYLILLNLLSNGLCSLSEDTVRIFIVCEEGLQALQLRLERLHSADLFILLVRQRGQHHQPAWHHVHLHGCVSQHLAVHHHLLRRVACDLDMPRAEANNGVEVFVPTRILQDDLLHGEVEDARDRALALPVHKGHHLQQAVIGNDLPQALRQHRCCGRDVGHGSCVGLDGAKLRVAELHGHVKHGAVARHRLQPSEHVCEDAKVVLHLAVSHLHGLCLQANAQQQRQRPLAPLALGARRIHHALVSGEDDLAGSADVVEGIEVRGDAQRRGKGVGGASGDDGQGLVGGDELPSNFADSAIAT
mmetsp:Transcript_46510/g.118710  ORF Transcript_46510/g.118710 Transcript_46510/m.118710 type:complete len:342 (+) Transcript_46510:215-1240(+)